jgi:D-alanyl-D-alanine carboxypeptidase/D-alanyl-D-alanine-endopeptidase (penicillin-binding protein 4)
MKKFLFLILVFSISTAYAQGLKQKIENAFKTLESDPQMKYAGSSLSVLNAETGDVIFSSNGNTGLASASTLKTITSASAYHILWGGYWSITIMHF